MKHREGRKLFLSLSLPFLSFFFLFLLRVRLLGQGKNSSSIVYAHIHRDSARTNLNLLTTISLACSLACSLVLLWLFFLSLCRRRRCALRSTNVYNIDNSDHDIDDLYVYMSVSYSSSLITLIRSTSKYIMNISVCSSKSGREEEKKNRKSNVRNAM